MDFDNILEIYKELGISEDMWPEYDNANEFADKIRICSLTQDVNIITSGSSNARLI